MAPARAYQVDELLKLRRNVQPKTSSEVLRRINSEAGIKVIFDMALAAAMALHTSSPATPGSFLFGKHDTFSDTSQGRSAFGSVREIYFADGSPEHVLRLSSNGSDPTGLRTRNRSSSIITNPYEGFEVPPSDEFVPFKVRPNGRSTRQSKYSPTPSIKRGKAELLLKEHGSPPGIRVTAGGRIVPDGLTPITSPRFDQRRPYAPRPSAQINIPAIDIHNLPSPGYLQTVQGHLVVADGQIYQVHNGGLVAVGQVGSAVLDLICPPSNHVLAPGTNYGSGVDWQVPAHQMTYAGFPPVPEHAHINEHTIRKLEECHAKFQDELRELDRNEVLQRESLTASGKREIVRQRVALVNRIDETRRSILTARKVLNDRALNPDSDRSGNMNGHSTVRIVSPPAFSSQQAMSVPPSFEYGFMPNFDFPTPDASQYPMSAPLLAQTFGYSTPDMNSVLHVGPEFVPLQARHSYSTGTQLQVRAGNAGLGISNNAATAGGEHAQIKVHDEPVAPRGINFDGSGHQSKRSHAVPIKAPEQSIAEKKAALNPASPSYDPGASAAHKRVLESDGKQPGADEVAFTPSVEQMADVDQLVQSPARQPIDVHPTRPKHRISNSTAGTEDFFPQNAQEHSTMRYSYDTRDQPTGLQGWMNQENDSKHLSTPQRPSIISNKFIWNDSPEDRFFDALTEHDERPRMAFSAQGVTSPFYEEQSIPSRHDGAHGDASPVHSPSPIKPNRAKANYHAHSYAATAIGGESPMTRTPGGQTPVGYLMRKSSSAGIAPISPVRSLYNHGFDDGLSNKLDGVHSELEYLQGLREGLQERTRQMYGDSARSGMTTAALQHRVASALHHQGQDRASDSGYVPMSRRESMPSCSAPGAPVNTPLGTPIATTPKTGMSFDGKFSPATALAFSSQPNVKVADICRGVGTQTSAARLQRPEMAGSPLIKRPSGGSFQESMFGSPGESFASRMQRLEISDRRERVDGGDMQHAYAARSKAFVMPSTDQAHAVFHQHDGFIEGSGKKAGQATSDATSKSEGGLGSSPTRADSQPTGSRSPGKRLVSAAATVLAYGRRLASPEPHARSPVSPVGSQAPSSSKARMGWRRRAEEKPGNANSTALSPK